MVRLCKRPKKTKDHMWKFEIISPCHYHILFVFIVTDVKLKKGKVNILVTSSYRIKEDTIGNYLGKYKNHKRLFWKGLFSFVISEELFFSKYNIEKPLRPFSLREILCFVVVCLL
jgi:hypothetical protein